MLEVVWEQRYRRGSYYRRLEADRTMQLTIGRMAIVNRPARRESNGAGVVALESCRRIKSDWRSKQ